ncbi:hypothetical protein [Neptunomonas japonica]|uniref:hypothetical protein n=1 Tax=Neptunomonas japonica TaxID=417574 RepID=UPI0003F52622|nr:hypothetical protein [Neptunomonas japonica]
MWAIYKTSQTLIEGTEAYKLSQQFPHAVSHDDVNTVFVTSLESPANAFVLPSIDRDGNVLPIDQVALLAAQYLFGEQPHGMILTKLQAITLFTHPAHKLWCAKYEDDQRDQFKADYNYVGSFITAMGDHVAWPAFTPELTPAEARQYMLMGLSQIN